MADDLVERLRDFDPHLHEWEVVDEAADRIEGLEENQRFIIRERDRTFALILARTEKAEAERDRVEQVLKEVAQTLAWQSFGECRGFSDNLLSPLEAYNLAKAELKG